VVGVTWNANGTAEDAFLISGSTVTYLGNLGGSMSGAYAINKSGLIAGYTEAPGMSQEAFLYSGGTMAGLGTLGGGTSFAQGINNSGQVVGIASYHAFLWSSSTGMTDLGTLFGQSGSDAEAINSSGQVAGSCFTVGGNGSDDHAFLWSSSTGMTYLGTLGGAYSTAYAINDMGMVVGDSETAAGQEHAFLYSGGTMYDLNTLISPLSGWTLTYADGINDQGQIIGFGLYDGSTRSFLLTPNAVPEPISMIFFGTGLVAVGGYVARRKMLRTA
jgi:probable HAF family extracellular repeat protein